MKKWIAVSLIALLLPLSQVLGETAEELVAKNLAARGGAESMAKLESLRATGTNKLPSGAEVPLVVMRNRTGQFRQESSFNGYNMVMASDGETAWRSSAAGGAQKMDSDQALIVQLQTDFDGVLYDYQQYGYELILLDEAIIGELPVHHLRLTHPERTNLDVYLDQDSYLEKQVSATVTVGDSPWEVNSFFADYREVALPHAIQVHTTDRVAADMRIEKFEINVPLEKSLFEMPKATKKGE
jgi:hypothetical protein